MTCEQQHSDHHADCTTATVRGLIVPPDARICWLGGWGISTEAMLATVRHCLPHAKHCVLLPTAESVQILRKQLTAKSQGLHTAAVANAAAPNVSGASNTAATATADFFVPDIVAGYSTGAFLLLRDLLADIQNASTPLLLFAPFADFRKESELGGKIVSTRLKLLLRRLRSSPLAAVADFYLQSGVHLPAPTELPYAQDDLVWGIEQLAETSVSADNLEKLKNITETYIQSAWIGAQDALLEPAKIAELFTHGTCHIAHSASHDLSQLLAAALAEGGSLE